MGEVVSNTSPLLYLHQLGMLDLLPALYSQVLVPASVVEELDAGRAAGHDVPNIAALPWARVVSSPTLALLALATDLGKGEAEAIAIAHERNALLILDDGLARRHAKLVGVTLTGTLVRAKRPARVPIVMSQAEVRAVLAELRGVWHLMPSLLYGSGLRPLDA